MELDPQLVDPICEGSIVQVGFEHRRKIDVSTIFGKCMSTIFGKCMSTIFGPSQIGPYTAFTNPPMSFARFLNLK